MTASTTKIEKHNRISLRHPIIGTVVIYTSVLVLDGIRKDVVSFTSGKYHPRRDCSPKVVAYLLNMAARLPNHFTHNGLSILASLG